MKTMRGHVRDAQIRLFLLLLPGKLRAAIILGATMTSAFAAAIATRTLFDINQLVADIELTRSVYGVLGTMYGILLAFAISGIWEKYKAAVVSVHAETDALLGIGYILGASPTEQTKEIRSKALAYAKLVVDEWHMLGEVARREVAPMDLSYDAAMALLHAVQSLKPSNDRETVVFEQAIVTANDWLDARRKRLQSAIGGNAAAIWPLLISGALVLFAFYGLFVAKSTEVWAALLIGLSLVVGISFALIFSLDHPFTGRSIHAGPFRWVIKSWQREKPFSPSEPAA
jgi:hypothetical protein